MSQSLIIRMTAVENELPGIKRVLRWLWRQVQRQAEPAQPPALDRDGALVAMQFLLARHFSLDELRQLCFEMQIDFDGLDGVGREGKARELVLYCDRHGRLSELLEKARQERPREPWAYVASLDTGPLTGQ